MRALIAAVLVLAGGSAMAAESAAMAFDAARLATLNSGGTFAKPLPLADDRLLLFERDGPRAIVQRIDWRADTITTEAWTDLPLADKQRYTAVQTSAGLWLVGPRIVVARTDGAHVAHDFDANEPNAVGLRDGSILVLDTRIRRIAIDAAGTIAITDLGLLSYDGEPDRAGTSARQPRGGYTATTLADGRVLFVGGDQTRRLASIFDPADRSMRAVGTSPHPRVNAVSVLLPDGRVAIAGGGFSAREADIYDPRSDRWTTLPALPFPLYADAYGGDTPSLAAGPNGGLVAGGHLEDHVLQLPATAEGYAADWHVVGGVVHPHISGVLQVLSSGDVIVAGGVYNPAQFGGCCRASPGVERIAHAVAPVAWASTGLAMNGSAIVQRTGRALIAAGRRFSWTGTGQMRYSAMAELMTLADGKVTQVASLPFATGAADAAWLDDDRVIVKGRVEADDRSFEPGGNLASRVPASSGALAIFSVVSGQWHALPLPSTLATARLIGARGETALLFAADASVHALDIPSGKTHAIAQAAIRRQGASTRWLADGRVVIAGGRAQSDLVSLVDTACEGEAPKACAERFVGYGPYGKAKRYEILDEIPDAEHSTASPKLSASSRGAGTRAVIRADGRVVQVGWIDDTSTQLLIEQSDAHGAKWETLPLPDDLLASPDDAAGCHADAPDDCRVLLTTDPRDPGRELVFLRTGSVAQDGADPQYLRLRLWWFDEHARTWRRLFDLNGPAARTPPLDLPEPLSGLRATGWHLDTPVVWRSP